LPLTEPKKILIGFPRTIADTLQATSLLAVLKRQYPQAKVDILLPSLHVPVLNGNSNLNEIICFTEEAPVKALFSIMRRMRDRAYDVSIDLAGTFQTAFLFFLSRPNGRLNCARKKASGDNPLVWRFQTLVRLGLSSSEWPSPAVALTPDERDWAKTYLISGGMHLDRPIVAIHPWHLWTQKLVNKEEFIRLAGILLERGLQVILTQSVNQGPILQEIMDKLPRQIICIRDLEMRRMAAVLSRVQLFISDSHGPIDLAVATGSPVLCICRNEREKGQFTYKAYSPHKAIVNHKAEDILALVDEMG
jgi:ADP-heptose:LPS heptosyltransferase